LIKGGRGDFRFVMHIEDLLAQLRFHITLISSRDIALCFFETSGLISCAFLKASLASSFIFIFR
jgi:hypothetical protein